jgi:hypothetical protein
VAIDPLRFGGRAANRSCCRPIGGGRHEEDAERFAIGFGERDQYVLVRIDSFPFRSAFAGN